ncbi:hypothetical protein BPLS_P3010 [Bathymodiolus platifrons methanotrophic gill symbiont]|nr:hypothetical protein BMR08_16140 [Methylococcaceae bacterium CS2]TXL12722.1 hypothetical protein BMR05_14480 [Methylococcaceae bacterium HT4]TXL15362.1 hypothetical protein BMR04_11815 [Methylococcaceae bacterium HT3]GFO75667.1 hypothetical protein BPLS_P3010 [Bathymodiolus platifrons methanotrophic gill symbiont]
MNHKYIILVTMIILSGCAKHAIDISPAAISTSRYSGWNCNKLSKELSFVEGAVTRVSAEQDEAADHDALMVFLIGVPTSGGGVKGQVADLKGQAIALHGAQMEMDCFDH